MTAIRKHLRQDLGLPREQVQMAAYRRRHDQASRRAQALRLRMAKSESLVGGRMGLLGGRVLVEADGQRGEHSHQHHDPDEGVDLRVLHRPSVSHRD
jgi:hypothetical protein